MSDFRDELKALIPDAIHWPSGLGGSLTTQFCEAEKQALASTLAQALIDNGFIEFYPTDEEELRFLLSRECIDGADKRKYILNLRKNQSSSSSISGTSSSSADSST